MNFLSPVWMEMVADLFSFDILTWVARTGTGVTDQLVSCSDSEIKMHEIITTAATHTQYQLVVFSAPPTPDTALSGARKSSSLLETICEGATPGFLGDKFRQMCHDKCIRWHMTSKLILSLVFIILLDCIKIELDENTSGLKRPNVIQLPVRLLD